MAAERLTPAARGARRAVALLACLALGVSIAPAVASAVSLRLSLGGARPAVPSDFLGLSFEAKSLPQVAAYASNGNLPGYLRSLGSGVMRFGGVTADTQTAWDDGSAQKPTWATTAITRPDLAGIGALAREAGWRVLLAVNFGHYDPRAAASEASAAQTAIGAALAGIELGNEPDAYLGHGFRSAPWTFSQYQPQADDYRSAIAAQAPGIPLAGPDISSTSNLSWVRDEATSVRPALLTYHFYPRGCHDATPPQASDLLGPGVRHKEMRTLTRLAALQRSSGIPLRIGETNNVSCGGMVGVSNTFAAALWATDYLARTMAAGLAGVNFHTILSNCLGYAPLCAPSRGDLEHGTLRAQPEWYALLLARQLLGDRPLRPTLDWGRPSLSVTPLLSAHGRLHLVVVDRDAPGARPALLRVRLPARFTGGTVLALAAPSPYSSGGISLGGRAVRPNGSWAPAPHLPRVHGKPGSLTVTIQPSSAALVTLTPGG